MQEDNTNIKISSPNIQHLTNTNTHQIQTDQSQIQLTPTNHSQLTSTTNQSQSHPNTNPQSQLNPTNQSQLNPTNQSQLNPTNQSQSHPNINQSQLNPTNQTQSHPNINQSQLNSNTNQTQSTSNTNQTQSHPNTNQTQSHPNTNQSQLNPNTNQTQSNPKSSQPSSEFDVLIVAGGAVKGISMLGALHYAFDNNLLNNIHTLVGTSVGSMIIYFMSIGYSPIEIFKKIHKHKIFERLNASTNLTGMIGEGILPFTHIQEILEKMTIDKIGYYPTLKDIQNKFNKKLIMVTYNLSKDNLEYLNPDENPDLPCLTAIRMSSNIPFLFEQFKYMGCYYIDGGIADNFPIKLATKYGKNMIGFYTSEDNDSVSLDNNKIVSYIMKLIFIMPNIHLKHILEENKDKGTFINIVDSNPMLNFNLSTKDKLNLFSIGFGFSKTKLEKFIS